MGIVERIGAVVIIALLFGGMSLYVYMDSKSKRQERECNALRAELAECSRLHNVVNSAVERQNEAIVAVRVDTATITREKTRIVTRYATMRDTVTQRTERDESAENQLYSIVDMLRRFHGMP
jgi:hypothetical protein